MINEWLGTQRYGIYLQKFNVIFHNEGGDDDNGDDTDDGDVDNTNGIEIDIANNDAGSSED